MDSIWTFSIFYITRISNAKKWVPTRHRFPTHLFRTFSDPEIDSRSQPNKRHTLDYQKRELIDKTNLDLDDILVNKQPICLTIFLQLCYRFLIPNLVHVTHKLKSSFDHWSPKRRNNMHAGTKSFGACLHHGVVPARRVWIVRDLKKRQTQFCI